MAITSYPFDGQDTTEDQYSRLFAELQDTGVAAAASAPALAVSADGSTLVVSVAPGTAYVRGHMFESTEVEELVMPVPTESVATHRIVLRLDPAANGITLEVIEGTAGLPAPDLTQGQSGVYEMPLARVQVGANVSAITPADIVDERPFAGTRIGTWRGSASRPKNPRDGEIGFNVTTGAFEYWNGVAWDSLSDVPVGSMQMYAGSEVPAGYLRCDGSLYSAATYPRLAGALGRAFSRPDDASGTFRTPDLRAAFPMGASDGSPRGSTGGAASRVLTEANLPPHTHSIDHEHTATEVDGAHDHGYYYSKHAGAHAGTFGLGRFANRETRTVASGGIGPALSEHSHRIAPYSGSSGPAGSGQPVDMVPPFVAVHFIVKT